MGTGRPVSDQFPNPAQNLARQVKNHDHYTKTAQMIKAFKLMDITHKGL